MSAQIIYGVVFGKPKTEPSINPDDLRTIPHLHDVGGCAAFTFNGETTVLSSFTDDVYYMSPPIQLPCDSEAE